MLHVPHHAITVRRVASLVAKQTWRERPQRRGTRYFACLALLASVSLLVIAPMRACGQQPPQAIRQALATHCFDCHSQQDAQAGLSLEDLPFIPDNPQNQAKWIQLYDRVAANEMPPDKPLEQEARNALLKPLQQRIAKPIAEHQQQEGRTELRRLNRREFENTLHDLLGIETPLQHRLPPDTRTDGFDTIASGLRVSAVQIEKYLDAIDVALDAAFRLTVEPPRIAKRLSLKDEKEIRDNLDKPENEVDPASGNKHKHLFQELDKAVVFISFGYSPDRLRQFAPPADGRYRIRISAYAVRHPNHPVTLRVFASDFKSERLVAHFDMPRDTPRVVEFTLPLQANEHLRINGHGIGIDEAGKNVWNLETVQGWDAPGLAVEWVEVEGPLFDSWPPKPFTDLVGQENLRPLPQPGPWTDRGHLGYEIHSETPEQALRAMVSRFAPRAFRAPVEEKEVEVYSQIGLDSLQRGQTLAQAMRAVLKSILLSPRFLYLEENRGHLNDDALASRLSYFLWSTMPDEPLRQLAKEKRLSDPAVLRQQVKRMLEDPRSQAFVSSFVSQWLELYQIDATTPDMRLYPEYDELLRVSMLKESEAYFREMIEKDLSVSHVIDSDFVMIDRRLANHYGIAWDEGVAGSYGEQIRRVSKPVGSPRGGMLTQAAVLKVTANGTVTSPVTRGAWILRHIVGKPPSPPPPVPAIEPDTRGATTIREQLAKHRDVETCQRCHAKIDPPGFALESFDVIGGYRERYRSIEQGDSPQVKLYNRPIWEYKLGLPVDASGQTTEGIPFENVQTFKRLLMKQQDQVLRHFAKQLVAYATGATVSFADRPVVAQLVREVESKQRGVRSLIEAVVTSELFQSK